MKDTFWSHLVAFAAVTIALFVVGCSGSDGTDGAPGPAGSGVANQDIIIQADTNGDGGADTIAVIDPTNFAIKRSANADIGTDSSLNNTHKAFFRSGLEWIGGGGDLWAYDKDTLTLATRVDNPSFQFNRDGVVGQGLVNAKSAATTANLPKELKAFVGRSQLSQAEAAQVDMCDVLALAGPGNSATRAPADTIVHNMGYSPVGLETTPDGKMVVAGVRQGDHLLFIDNDPASPTFKTPVRFIDQRRGVILDKSNAQVGTFASQYAGFGGTAPGNLLRNRTGAGTGETDPETYVEPCDTAIISNFSGEVWFWSVDVDGDTYTLARVDTITSVSPTVVQITVPVVDDTALVGGTSGLQTVGPWMGSMANRVVSGEMLGTSENEGENSESIWDLSTPATPVEVGRYIPDLATVKGGGACTPGAPGGPTLTGPFVDGNTYSVNVDFTSTGGTCTPVSYTYNSLPGDDLSGDSDASGGAAGNVTTAYLAKDNPADPGPQYILNGLAGRAGTSEGNVASISANGVPFSDQIWLLTFRGGPQGNFDIFQIVDLSTDPPWLISEVIDLPSQFGGKFGPDNRFYQIAGNNLEIIDGNVKPRSVRTVKIADPSSGALWAIKSMDVRTP
jgi:hypothetical protein